MDGLFSLIDAWATALLLAASMLAAFGAGWWQGRRQRSAGGDTPAGKFDDASLALLGLLLAFTFSMALGKHDQRRMSLVADSNTIGDFYTSASMLPDPLRTQLQTAIREYTELRLAAARQQPEAANLEAVLRRMQEMHGRMTELVAEAVSAGTPIAVPLLNTLNGLTSSHAARLASLRDCWRPWPAEGRGGLARGLAGYSGQRRSTRLVLTPPKAKLLLTAISTASGRGAPCT